LQGTFTIDSIDLLASRPQRPAWMSGEPPRVPEVGPVRKQAVRHYCEWKAVPSSWLLASPVLNYYTARRVLRSV
jgi:hypothetical protein